MILSEHGINREIQRVERNHPGIFEVPGYELYREELQHTARGYEMGFSTEENLENALEAYDLFVSNVTDL